MSNRLQSLTFKPIHTRNIFEPLMTSRHAPQHSSSVHLKPIHNRNIPAQYIYIYLVSVSQFTGTMDSAARPACERCFKKRKKCVWSRGTATCERCERNGAVCVVRVRGTPGRASPSGGASKHSTTNSFVDATGFDESLLTMTAGLPPGHAGRRATLRYLTCAATSNGALVTVLALLEEAGVDVSDFKTDGPFAPHLVSLDTTQLWTDLPQSFRSHHDHAREFSEGARDMFCLRFAGSTLCVHTSARVQAVFGDGPVLTQTMMSTHFEGTSMSKFAKGLPHIVEACAEIGQLRTVVVDNLRMCSGIIVCVYMTMCVVGPMDVIYVCEMVTQEPAPIAVTLVAQEPAPIPLQWMLPEEDIRILQNMIGHIE